MELIKSYQASDGHLKHSPLPGSVKPKMAVQVWYDPPDIRSTDAMVKAWRAINDKTVKWAPPQPVPDTSEPGLPKWKKNWWN